MKNCSLDNQCPILKSRAFLWRKVLLFGYRKEFKIPSTGDSSCGCIVIIFF